MRTLSATSELIEKERIRLQINAQVEEFLLRGGAIEAVTGSGKPAMADVGNEWDDQEVLTPLSD